MLSAVVSSSETSQDFLEQIFPHCWVEWDFASGLLWVLSPPSLTSLLQNVKRCGSPKRLHVPQRSLTLLRLKAVGWAALELS